jgi:magnesium-transporting ATPase (P-type)
MKPVEKPDEAESKEKVKVTEEEIEDDEEEEGGDKNTRRKTRSSDKKQKREQDYEDEEEEYIDSEEELEDNVEEEEKEQEDAKRRLKKKRKKNKRRSSDQNREQDEDVKGEIKVDKDSLETLRNQWCKLLRKLWGDFAISKLINASRLSDTIVQDSEEGYLRIFFIVKLIFTYASWMSDKIQIIHYQPNYS